VGKQTWPLLNRVVHSKEQCVSENGHRQLAMYGVDISPE
jgi:hypothetical protein